MTRSNLNRSIVTAATLAALMIVVGRSPLMGEEKRRAGRAGREKRPAEKPVVGKAASNDATADAEKPKGRLPNHYAAVVDEKQRDKIYEIQASYTERIEK